MQRISQLINSDFRKCDEVVWRRTLRLGQRVMRSRGRFGVVLGARKRIVQCGNPILGRRRQGGSKRGNQWAAPKFKSGNTNAVDAEVQKRFLFLCVSFLKLCAFGPFLILRNYSTGQFLLFFCL